MPEPPVAVSRTLRLRTTRVLTTTKPFNFRLTTWKPSHFATGLERHTSDTTWRTMRIDDHFIGLRLDPVTATSISVRIYAEDTLRPETIDRIVDRVTEGYGLQDELDEFNHASSVELAV